MPKFTTLNELTKAPHAEMFEERRPRAVRLQLDTDERVPPHTHSETNVVFDLIFRYLELSIDDEIYDAKPGQLVRCSGQCKISPHALESSTAVVVLAPKEGSSD